MFPEISRRCLVCGASARAGARFCPQCGEELLAREVAHESEEERGTAAGGSIGAGSGGADKVSMMREAAAPDEARPREAPPVREVPPTRETRAVTIERLRHEAPPTRESMAFVVAKDEAERGGELTLEEGERLEDEGEAGAEKQAANRRMRAAARVRGVKENLKPRVERMRDDALVALEEAPADSDSGLRFVIIAVLLFLLFIVSLILSVYVLG
jgi:hypothetical protein